MKQLINLVLAALCVSLLACNTPDTGNYDSVSQSLEQTDGGAPSVTESAPVSYVSEYKVEEVSFTYVNVSDHQAENMDLRSAAARRLGLSVNQLFDMKLLSYEKVFGGFFKSTWQVRYNHVRESLWCIEAPTNFDRCYAMCLTSTLNTEVGCTDMCGGHLPEQTCPNYEAPSTPVDDEVVKSLQDCQLQSESCVDSCMCSGRYNVNQCKAQCVNECGDGFHWNAVEECDLGNNNGVVGSACTSECTNNVCGDGHVGPGESCDNGVNNGNGVNATCTSACALASCGDGIVNNGEQCDDGNDVNDDGCTNNCTLPVCGDGIVNGSDACDDGNGSNEDSCLNSCVVASCGDGHVRTGVEACDDGNDVNTDECTNVCELAACGDGYVQGDESCDNGEDNSDSEADACRTDCSLPVCGDNVVDSGEECDEDSVACNECVKCSEWVCDEHEQEQDGWSCPGVFYTILDVYEKPRDVQSACDAWGSTHSLWDNDLLCVDRKWSSLFGGFYYCPKTGRASCEDLCSPNMVDTEVCAVESTTECVAY